MAAKHIAFAIMAAGFAACSMPGKTPLTAEQTYPVAIKDSAERRDRADKDWKRMLDAYNLPQTAPDLYPITYTPKSLPGGNGGIKVMTAKAAQETQESALREAAKGFIKRWQVLTEADPAGISLTASNQTGDMTRFTYRQMSYPFPIAGKYGQMTLTLGADGTLREIDDRFIPVVDFPNRPSVDRATAIGSVLGRTLTSTGDGATADQVKITAKADISSARLVLLPVEKSGELQLHLAWQLTTAAKPTGWSIFVDAINGGVLLAGKSA
ncbi:MAG TPA: hypothetical protein VLZ81_06975 [Blastocatellia bacterium]|nr:hypothetical protein [Blastocatellia bacterium]